MMKMTYGGVVFRVHIKDTIQLYKIELDIIFIIIIIPEPFIIKNKLYLLYSFHVGLR